MSRDIPLSAIRPDPEQPRRHFDVTALRELADSIEGNGLASPILLRPDGEQFIIVHGERRFRAAQSLGWDSIPANVQEMDAATARWLAIIENVQREDLTPMEEARAYQSCVDAGTTQVEIGRRIGKTQSYIAQKLRLLRLVEPLQLYLERGLLTEGHARQLMRLDAMYRGHTAGVNRDALTFDSPEWAKIEAEAPGHQVGFYLMMLRPQDKPTCTIIPDDMSRLPIMADACRSLHHWASEHEGPVPVWVIAAFWWASLTVALQLSVADLRTSIDRWYERLASAVAWLWLFGMKGEADIDPRTDEGREYWAFKAELRHALYSSPRTIDDIPREMLEDAVRDWNDIDAVSLVLPSSLQPWGRTVEATA